MTLYLALYLHIYQPPTQSPSILKMISNESYKPLLNLLTEKEYAKITLNINGSLTELLEFYQEEEILENTKKLVRRNQIELVGTSCYHAILPLIPTEEITRQIILNEKIQKDVLGEEIFQPKGFWLPEMAYDERVIDPLIEKGYKWAVISSVACEYEEIPDNFIPQLNDKFNIYFRNDLLSNLVSFSNPTVEEFYKELVKKKEPKTNDYYVILAMDGETFGHHVRGHIENFLEPLFEKINNDQNIELIKISDIPLHFHESRKVHPCPSSWSTSAEDLHNGVPFPLWSDPENNIHNLQKTIMNHTLFLVSMAQKCYLNHNEKEEEIQHRFKNARTFLDKGLHSCQLWWASGKPWYSSEMILKGLNQLTLAASEALKVILWNNIEDNLKEKALNIFNEIFEAQKEIFLLV